MSVAVIYQDRVIKYFSAALNKFLWCCDWCGRLCWNVAERDPTYVRSGADCDHDHCLWSVPWLRHMILTTVTTHHMNTLHHLCKYIRNSPLVCKSLPWHADEIMFVSLSCGIWTHGNWNDWRRVRSSVVHQMVQHCCPYCFNYVRFTHTLIFSSPGFFHWSINNNDTINWCIHIVHHYLLNSLI